MELRFPRGLTATTFLQDYWQQHPLLLPGALRTFSDPISAEELAGLACEAQIESRLIQEHGGAQPWQLRHGPFSDDDFLNLPESHWTLLVQDVEKHRPELQNLLQLFRFIPDWRIDDLMISYAANHGSVGPHWDEYDVFLLQGQGRRRWQINTQTINARHVLTDTDLRIMAEFEAEQEWVLESGDILYLPPGVAHYGVALEPCLTYSIGFRAPSQQELLEHYLELLIESSQNAPQYRDPAQMERQTHPGEISTAAMQQAQTGLQQALDVADDLLIRCFGRCVTEPKIQFHPEPLDPPLKRSDLHTVAGNRTLIRNSGSRFAYYRHTDHSLRLFVDGHDWHFDATLAWLVQGLCHDLSYEPAFLHRILAHESACQLLMDLLNRGHIVRDDHY